MKETADEIRAIVKSAADALSSMNMQRVSSRKGPGTWSKKEILGHLIDSAANNHHRFVRGACNAAADFPAYNQNDWVRIQRYNESNWANLIALWSAYNLHLCDVIERLPAEAFSSSCNIGKEEPVSIEFVVKDYVRHLHHHMKVLLEE
ncbi:MAG: DinB family protein [Acidobacteriota bacterium]|jgi:hypothetical protein